MNTTEKEMVDLIGRYPIEFSQGFIEGLGAVGMTYDDDPESDRSTAYDIGRTMREGLHEILSAEDVKEAPPATEVLSSHDGGGNNL